jgi:hypothetical protein
MKIYGGAELLLAGILISATDEDESSASYPWKMSPHNPLNRRSVGRGGGVPQPVSMLCTRALNILFLA